MEGTMKDESEEEVIVFGQQRVQPEALGLAFPWYSEITSKLVDPILRMHNEAIEFYLYVSPLSDKALHQSNEQLFERIKDAVEGEEVLVVSPFFVNKLYLKGTQVQMFLLVESLTPEKADSIMDQLKVKIPACNYAQLGLGQSKAMIRIVERDDWQQYLALIDESIQSIVELKYLYMIFSCMIRQRWLHMSIRPVLLFGLLSVFYHERRKQRYRTLSENIIKFLEYYGVGPFQERRVNFLGKGRYQLLQDGPNQTPFSFWINSRCNISSSLLRDLFAILKNRYRLISNYNFDEEQSIIGSLVNPCSKQFQYV